jgi:hypothetical protein
MRTSTKIIIDQKNKTLDGSFVAQIYKSNNTHNENKIVITKSSLADSNFLALKKIRKPKTKAKITEILWE